MFGFIASISVGAALILGNFHPTLFGHILIWTGIIVLQAMAGPFVLNWAAEERRANMQRYADGLRRLHAQRPPGGQPLDPREVQTGTNAWVLPPADHRAVAKPGNQRARG